MRIPGLIVCFHRDQAALRQTDSRPNSVQRLSFDPSISDGVIASLRKLYQDKVYGLERANNPWIVFHTFLDPEVDYNFAWAQLRAAELLAAVLADADQLLVEGTLKLDDGVRIRGRVAQLGLDGETVLHGFDQVSGEFLETVVEQSVFTWAEVYAASVVREKTDIHSPMSLCHNVRISGSRLSGLFKIIGRSEEPDGRGRVSRSFIEGAPPEAEEHTLLQPVIWDRVVVPQGNDGPQAELRAFNEPTIIQEVKRLLAADGPGLSTRIAYTLHANRKRFAPNEIMADIAAGLAAQGINDTVAERLSLLEMILGH